MPWPLYDGVVSREAGLGKPCYEFDNRVGMVARGAREERERSDDILKTCFYTVLKFLVYMSTKSED
jgi:hypothetical protein